MCVCSSFEPAWAGAVGEKGDLFYVEPGDPDTVITPSSILVNNPPTSAILTHNGHHDITPTHTHTHKIKHGLKKKVKELITPKNRESKESNNNNHHNKTRYRNNEHNNVLSVTFNDVPTGLTKEVWLFVDPGRHNYGRRATLCETLFGVVPGHFNAKASALNGASRDSRIMVQGLLPGGEALKSNQVKIGECPVIYIYGNGERTG